MRQARVYSDGSQELPNPLPRAEAIPVSPGTGSTLWGEHRGFVIAVVTIAATQAVLIAGLLVQRARVRRTRIRLRESEQRYRQLIETQTDLVCRYRPDTTLTFVNEAYCRFFGLTRQALIGKKYVDLVAESERKAVLSRTESVVSRRERATFDHELVRPDGGRAWYHWDVYPIADARGRIAEFQAIGRDITDRKRAEEADRNLAHALRLAVAGELTAMVAHEVSQPLGAIMANADAAQMLLDADDPPLDEIRQILLDIRDSDRRADQAVRRMRALLGKRELNMQPLNLNESVKVALGLVSGDALRRGIHIQSELNPALPWVSGDPAWLQQVMLNLIVNAMDAMREISPAERRLTVATKRLEGDCIGFAVSDNGDGIPDDNIEQIFQSFYSTKRDGLGVGLAICRSIIDSHHGRIWAENNADGGATVQFCVRAA